MTAAARTRKGTRASLPSPSTPPPSSSSLLLSLLLSPQRRKPPPRCYCSPFAGASGRNPLPRRRPQRQPSCCLRERRSGSESVFGGRVFPFPFLLLLVRVWRRPSTLEEEQQEPSSSSSSPLLLLLLLTTPMHPLLFRLRREDTEGWAAPPPAATISTCYPRVRSWISRVSPAEATGNLERVFSFGSVVPHRLNFFRRCGKRRQRRWGWTKKKKSHSKKNSQRQKRNHIRFLFPTSRSFLKNKNIHHGRRGEAVVLYFAVLGGTSGREARARKKQGEKELPLLSKP